MGWSRLRRAVLVLCFVPWVAGCPSPDVDDDAERIPSAEDPVVAVGDLSPFQTRKAESLLRDRLSCLGCHALDGEGGRIGPDLSQVGSRLSVLDIRSVVSSPRQGSLMPRVPMPERWLELVARYLGGRVGAEGPVAPSSGEATAVQVAPQDPLAEPDGQALYQRHCAACHGATGAGDGPNAAFLPVPPTAHWDPAYMSRRPDDSLFDAIYAGGRVMNLSHRMPPFGQLLSRSQIRALVRHMRTLCDCQGPEWSRDDAVDR